MAGSYNILRTKETSVHQFKGRWSPFTRKLELRLPPGTTNIEGMIRTADHTYDFNFNPFSAHCVLYENHIKNVSNNQQAPVEEKNEAKTEKQPPKQMKSRKIIRISLKKAQAKSRVEKPATRRRRKRPTPKYTTHHKLPSYSPPIQGEDQTTDLHPNIYKKNTSCMDPWKWPLPVKNQDGKIVGRIEKVTVAQMKERIKEEKKKEEQRICLGRSLLYQNIKQDSLEQIPSIKLMAQKATFYSTLTIYSMAKEVTPTQWIIMDGSPHACIPIIQIK